MLLLRYASIAVTLLELCLLCAYYVPMAVKVPWMNLGSVDFRSFDDNYVSDLLFRDQVYKALLTACVFLQLLMCAVFVWILNSNASDSVCPSEDSCIKDAMQTTGVEYRLTLVFELMCLLMAFIGWVVLVSFYLDGEGHLSLWHIVGTVLFIVASGLYFASMILNMLGVYQFETVSEQCAFGWSTFAFVSSVGAGIVFMVSFLDKQVPFGWMFEHAAFILLVGAHVLLFWTDALIRNAASVKGPRRVSALLDSVRIVRPICNFRREPTWN